MKLVSRTESIVVVEDDGGFLNFIPINPIVVKQELTPEEQEKLNQKLDDLGIVGF